MSIARIFSVIGDRNVRDHMTTLNVASREAMKGAEIISCPSLINLASVFTEIRAESNVCIFAGLTELIVSAEKCSSLSSTVDPVLSAVRDKLVAFCSVRPLLQVVLAPPLYRPLPLWYRDGLAQIATKFSACFGAKRPPNFHVMPSFVSQDLCPDGVMLTPVSGLHYVIHLFDEAVSVLEAVESPQESRLSLVLESVRSHDDRLAYIEHDHSRLHHRVDRRVAIESEFSDWVTNRSEEDWLTIRNLPRLSSELNRQEWQVEVKKQVRDALKLGLNALKVHVDFKVLVVTNPFRHRNTGPTLYNVKLNSVDASQTIRDSFSGFYRRANPVKRPSSLRGVSVQNKVTLNTRIRVEIMRQLGERYLENNRGASYHVKGYDSRPTILVTPPASSKSRPRTFNFIEAVSMLPSHFSDEQLTRIFMTVGTNNRGLLRQFFLVLNDDVHDHCLDLVKKYHEDRQAQRSTGQSSGTRSRNQVSFSTAQTHSAVFSGPGAGMEVESRLRQLLSASPPPPPPTLDASGKEVSPPRKGRAGKTSRTKSKKRARSPSRSPSPKRRSKRRARSTSRSRSTSPRRRSKKRSRRSRSRSSSRSGSAESESSGGHQKSQRERKDSSSESSGSDRGGRKRANSAESSDRRSDDAKSSKSDDRSKKSK